MDRTGRGLFLSGRATLNGVKSDNEQRNTRAGFTVALPIERQNSPKLSASTGITTRIHRSRRRGIVGATDTEDTEQGR
jgi:hypothetical protein